MERPLEGRWGITGVQTRQVRSLVQEDLEPVELAPTQRRPARTIQSDPPGIPLSVLSSQSICPSHLSTYLPICL